MSTELQLPTVDAIKVCQSMGMILASPQDQKEYDNLKHLLRNESIHWENAAIAGYRSNGTWFDSGDKLNYDITWGVDEPNELKVVEACMFLFTRNGIFANNDPCDCQSFAFICEFNHKRAWLLAEQKDDVSRFLQPLKLSSLEENKLMRRKLYLSRIEIKVTWIDAVLMCRSLGMEIFSPETAYDLNDIMERLSNYESVTSVHVGLTNLGSPGGWYSINTGNIVAHPIEGIPSFKNFLELEKDGIKYRFSGVESLLNRATFICQKIIISNDVNENADVFE